MSDIIKFISSLKEYSKCNPEIDFYENTSIYNDNSEKYTCYVADYDYKINVIIFKKINIFRIYFEMHHEAYVSLDKFIEEIIIPKNLKRILIFNLNLFSKRFYYNRGLYLYHGKLYD